MILSFICARLRSTSARFDSVSAKLPPVSRWIASVMTKNWNSGVPRRSAVSCSAASIVRPIFILSDTPRNSMPTGPWSSVATMPSVSVIGRPERSPRTISSIASGKLTVNLAMRRLIILPTTKCGTPKPANSREQEGEQERRALDQHERHDDQAEPDRDQAIFGQADLLAGLLEPLAQQRRLGDQGRGNAFGAALALGHELADLRLGAGRQHAVGVALLEQLEPALDRLARARPAQGLRRRGTARSRRQ